MDDSAQSEAAAVGGAIASDADQASGVSRRSFLATGAAAGVAAGLLGPLGKGAAALADGSPFRITKGDVAILQFLAAAELIEADLWQQYNELGGIQDSQV